MRERNIDVLEKHQLATFCMHPDGGPGWANLQPRHVPPPEIELVTFQVCRMMSNQLSHIGWGLTLCFAYSQLLLLLHLACQLWGLTFSPASVS